ncbi:MAG TPA: beta-ketoacyl-ACP synthase II [Chloroflexota bacterium]|nr:beta-ketoacyl-ACP synthase II [Chloroflexota bacterium]
MPENLDANRRVVVTGLGLICAVGVGLKQCWSRLLAGEGGVRRITRFDPEGFESQIAAEVQGFDPLDYMERKEARRMDRFAQFAVAAAREALQSATLAISPRDSERVGVIIGSAMGGMGALEDAYATLHSRGPSRVSPFFVPMMLADLAAGQVSILLGARGPNWAPVSACATGAHAIGEAAAIIRRGDADVILAGGAEAPITPASVAGYASMGALSRHNAHPERASRPFDAERDGFVIGEGAGVLVLESEEHARARDATILALVAGYGATADAYHIVEPSPGGGGAARAMRLALSSAGLQPPDLGYLNAHGTSTPTNDRLETAAIKAALCEHAAALPISSIKGAIGHTLGAGGAVEAAISVMVLQTGKAPPTINYRTPDPDCDLDYVPNLSRDLGTIGAVMTNSMGFGGHNASVVFTHPEAR